MAEAADPLTEADRTGRVARSTLIVMGGLASSVVVGFLRQRVIALKFGTGAEFDAYTAANGIPELLFTILSGGALAFAFIPVYTEFLAPDDRSRGNALVSQVINTVLILTALASALTAFLAPTLVRVPWGIGPHFPPEIQALTVQLMRILLFSTVFFAVSSFVSGTLHAHQHFLLPAITPVMYSAGIIFGARELEGIHGLAWGAVLGSLLHLLIQVPGLIRYRVRWRPTLGWGEPALRRVAVLMAPRVVDLMMARISIDWINANLGSGLGEGRLSALRFAFQLMNMPWTLIGTAIGIAVFPTMAALAARKDLGAQRAALSGALRAVLTLALPAAIGLIVLGRPVIRVVYEGGEFTAESTELVYFALRFYTVTLLSQTTLEVVVRAFASQQDTLTPLLVSFFTTALNLGLAVLLSRPLAQGGLEHGGLALANGIAVGVESLIGLTILHVRWRGIDAPRILKDAGKAVLAALAMGGTILLMENALRPGPLVTLALGAGLGLGVYFGVALLLGIEEIRTVPLAVLRGLRASRAV